MRQDAPFPRPRAFAASGRLNLRPRGWVLAVALAVSLARGGVAAAGPAQGGTPSGDLEALMRGLESAVYDGDEARSLGLAGVLTRDVRARVQAASARESDAWAGVRTRADWEAFRDA